MRSFLSSLIRCSGPPFLLTDPDDTTNSTLEEEEEFDDLEEETALTVDFVKSTRHVQSETCHKKTVTFQLTANQEYDNHLYCREDCANLLWYNIADYQCFRSTHNFLIREIRQMERQSYHRHSSGSFDSQESSSSSSREESHHIQKALLETYMACCSEPEQERVPLEWSSSSSTSICSSSNSSDCSSLEQEEEQPNKHDNTRTDSTDKQLTHRLSQWLHLSSFCRHGLERTSSREIRLDILERRRTLHQRLAEIQSQSSTMSTYHHWFFATTTTTAGSSATASSHAYQAEWIRQTCQQVTHPSRRFAQYIAQAQAAAPESSSIPTKLLASSRSLTHNRSSTSHATYQLV